MSAATIRRSAVETAVFVGRGLRHSARSLDTVLIAVMVPVLVLLLFVYVFGGAISTEARYVDYVVPGILLMCAAMGCSGTAVAVNQDMSTGVIDRFRSLPILGGAVLTGHVVAAIVRTAISTTLVVGVALLIGFRPTAGLTGWIAVAGLLLLVMAATAWLAAAFGLLVSNPEAAGSFLFLVLFPPYLSSAFVPVDTMPAALRAMARHQPVTPLTETLRELLLGAPGGVASVAVAWCVAGLLLGCGGAHLLFRRHGSR